ncbi:carboxypeptidase-like regulatory domain-containing protein [Flavobacterium sp.]|uniref:carboxypeptidase-like regulatory domain-containing protein n=1 Tax=Flavobacterium sp. TaxID=239 RepID=UPI0026057392|nr:carboxypeptidase-like regulatory domain-containing protein [Flavobacterium sp.]
MKSVPLLLLLFLSFTTSFSQVIKGKIVDNKNQPLPGANIYFDGTTVATIADSEGNFTLQYGSKLNSILAVSFIGYQTQYIQNYQEDKELVIILKEAVNVLNEVVLKKNRFSRKQKLQLFREQFLGQTNVGKKAKIENEDDLYFDYDETTNTFKAYCDKPLIINNTLLGYKINYELVDFEVKFVTTSIKSVDVYRSLYLGLSRYEEIEATPKIIKQRQECYEGSQLHFFRNLVNNIWNKDNFLLFVGKFQDNPNDYFAISNEGDSKKVTITKQDKTLVGKKFIAEFNLLFKKKKQSRIIFETETFFVDQFGNNSNVQDIIFSGYIAQLKVADMLPMNYGVK